MLQELYLQHILSVKQFEEMIAPLHRQWYEILVGDTEKTKSLTVTVNIEIK